MSTSGELINDLVGRGFNYEQIGHALGPTKQEQRHRSLIRQIAKGAKPGNNLEAALQELRDRVAAGGQLGTASAPPSRRTTAKGRAARVRTKTTYAGRGWSSGTVKRQGVRSGARNLHKLVDQAAGNGDDMAVTVAFDKSVTVQSYGKSKRARSGAGGVIDFSIDSEAAADHIAAGGTFAEFVAGEAMRSGYVSGHATAAEYVGHMLSLEARAY